MGATAGFIIGYHTGTGLLLFTAVGAFFGILPDWDIILQDLGGPRHRNVWSHSLLSSAILSIMMFALWHMYPLYVPRDSWLVVFTATFLHTAADSLTYSGTRMFFPFSGRTIRGEVRYDSIAANTLLILSCPAAIIVMIPALFHKILEALCIGGF